MGVLPEYKIRKLGILCENAIDREVIGGKSGGYSQTGYDLRVKQNIELYPGGFALASTIERFNMPWDVVGVVHDKSSWAREGVAIQNTVLEIGWRGFLTLELSRHAPGSVYIPAGSPIGQVLFHRVEWGFWRRIGKLTRLWTPPLYSGKYQDQEDMPVPSLSEPPLAAMPLRLRSRYPNKRK